MTAGIKKLILQKLIVAPQYLLIGPRGHFDFAGSGAARLVLQTSFVNQTEEQTFKKYANNYMIICFIVSIRAWILTYYPSSSEVFIT